MINNRENLVAENGPGPNQIEQTVMGHEIILLFFSSFHPYQMGLKIMHLVLAMLLNSMLHLYTENGFFQFASYSCLHLK